MAYENGSCNVCVQPTLALNRRGQERKEYDAKIKEAEKAAEEAAQAEQAMQAKIDAEEVKELRQTLVHKAAPIRDNYAPVPAKNTQQATLVSLKLSSSYLSRGYLIPLPFESGL